VLTLACARRRDQSAPADTVYWTGWTVRVRLVLDTHGPLLVSLESIMTINNDDTLIPVQVPRRHLSAVYGLIASLDSAAVPSSVEGDETELVEATWTLEDLRRFAKTPTTTSVTIGKVLDELAKKPGDYFSTSQLEDLTGVQRPNLKGAFSALTRHINAHYQGRDWMLACKWGPDLGAGYPAEMHYRLSEEQAGRWVEARTA
jgi:hypothetical protein